MYNILVVDDDKEIVNAIEIYLSKEEETPYIYVNVSLKNSDILGRLNNITQKGENYLDLCFDAGDDSLDIVIKGENVYQDVVEEFQKEPPKKNILDFLAEEQLLTSTVLAKHIENNQQLKYTEKDVEEIVLDTAKEHKEQADRNEALLREKYENEIRRLSKKLEEEKKEALHYQDILEFRLEDDTKAYEYTVKNEAASGDIVTCNVKRGSTIFKGQKVYRTKNAALLSWIDEKIESVDDKISLKGEMTAKIGKPIALKLQGLSHEVTVFGEPLQRAVNRPVTKDEIEKRLRKMGNTNYKLTDFSIILDDDSFVPMGEIAKLKREALAAFEREAVSGRSVEEQKPHKKKELPVWQNASILKVSTMEQLRTAVRTDENDVWIELPVALFAKEEDEVIKLLQNRPVLLSFPRIMKAGAEEKWRSLVNRLFVGAVVINSHRALLVAKKRFKDCPWIAAETFYHENERAKEVLAEFGICQAIKRGYGRKEVMVTKGCLKRTLDRCDGKKERILVSGGKGDKFYVVNNCDFCYNTIYTKNGEKKPELDKPAWHHFTWETADEMRKVLKTWNLL